MAVIANKRSIMTLYSDPLDLYCHQVRIVLAEKGIGVEAIDVLPGSTPPSSLLEINPYASVPTLIDRDLVLYEAPVIMEYLDERFPHPPLLPVYPVARAKSRLMLFRIQQDWYTLYHGIVKGDEQQAQRYRQQLQDSLVSLNPVFTEKPYFLSDEFSMVDCCLAPLLWRLPSIGIDLPASAKGIKTYMERIFSRADFKISLSEAEKELH